MALPPMHDAFNSAANAPPVSHVKPELSSDSTPMQQQSPPSLAQNLLPQSQERELPVGEHGQQGGEQEPPKAQFLKSVDQLCNLSSAINEFYRRYDELQRHLNFIQSAIDARSKEQQQPQQIQPLPQQAGTEPAVTKTERAKSSASEKSDLVILCELMCGRGLRKYIISRLSKIGELRAEVPSALKRAAKPAKLVLDCIGRFYLQGIRAYSKDSHMTPGRQASVLILEFFMLILNNEIEFDSDVKKQAEEAAMGWRKRLLSEGGISKACETDARGLLLFVGCYGIPKVFSNDDIWNLIRLSNSKEIEVALRRSPVLVKRISDILERMMSYGMKLEAVDITSTFGIEDKFPLRKILNSYLRDLKEASLRRKRDANTPSLLKAANEKQLAALKSVVNFLEERNLDPMKLLAGWQIKEKIDNLEKDLADLNKKIDVRNTPKRKTDENEFLNNLKNQDAKRVRFTGSPLLSSPSHRLHEQRILDLVDGNGLYNASRRLNLLDGGFPGHVSNPSIAPMLYGSSSFSATYSVPSTSSFAGVRAEMLVDRTAHLVGSSGLSYGWHSVRDASLIDGSGGQSFAHQPASGLFAPSSSLVEGFASLRNSPPPPAAAANRTSTSDLYRFADAVV